MTCRYQIALKLCRYIFLSHIIPPLPTDNGNWKHSPQMIRCCLSHKVNCSCWWHGSAHYNDAMMGTIASQITSCTIVYSTVYSDADQRKHQSSASLAFVRGLHPGPVNSPHKWPVTLKMFPFDDVIMKNVYMVSTELTRHNPSPTWRDLISQWFYIALL